ncbi:MAG: hypothetical protein ABIK67_04640, partial [candidate division WOR-3 bacterium]
MFRKVIHFSLLAIFVTSLVVCKKKMPTKDETRAALREGAETINTDVLNNTGGKALIGSMNILQSLPLGFGSKKSEMLKVLAGGKKAIPRLVLTTLNATGPWDTLAGKWRWNASTSQWEHYSTVPADSILFSWLWVDSAMVQHNCLLALSNYQWT